MRHAVVIIHGIGEQRPMQTLRGFVDAVLPDVDEGNAKFWSAPDELSELFELRVLKTTHRPRNRRVLSGPSPPVRQARPGAEKHSV